MPGMEIGAGEHAVQNSAEATKAGAELFPQTDGNDHALIKWLQTQEADARCRSLLHQIRQWTGREANEEMRSLAQAQGIKVTRQHRSTTEKLVQTARQHFEAAIAQEKGRLSCFRFNIGKGASEHLQPVPEEEQDDAEEEPPQKRRPG